MDMENNTSKTEINMMVITLIINLKVKELMIGIRVQLTQVILKKEEEMDLVYGNQVEQIVIFMKDNTLTIKNMGMEFINGVMVQSMKETLKMISSMEKVLLFMKMEKWLIWHGKMERQRRKYKDNLKNNNNNHATTINYPRENYRVEFLHHRHKVYQKNQAILFFEIVHQADQHKIYKVHIQIVLEILTQLLQKG